MTVFPLSSLQQRLLTASLLIPLVVWAVLVWPNSVLAGLFALIVLLGADEWAGLMGISHGGKRWGYRFFIAAGLLAGWQGLSYPGVLQGVFAVTALLWGVAVFVVRRYPQLPLWWQDPFVQALLGLVLLVPPWMALVFLHGGTTPETGPHSLLFLLILIWGADSGAFFFGKRWGKRRLIPQVSPGKTWEGLWGALLTTGFLAVVANYWLKPGRPLVFAVLCGVVVIYSVLGDLLESVAKRLRGVKDSGSLLPGHGGVLDRIDSLTAAAPVYAWGVLWLGS